MMREPHPKGWVWRYRTEQELRAGFYQYKYFVTFEDDFAVYRTYECADCYARM